MRASSREQAPGPQGPAEGRHSGGPTPARAKKTARTHCTNNHAHTQVTLPHERMQRSPRTTRKIHICLCGASPSRTGVKPSLGGPPRCAKLAPAAPQTTRGAPSNRTSEDCAHQTPLPTVSQALGAPLARLLRIDEHGPIVLVVGALVVLSSRRNAGARVKVSRRACDASTLRSQTLRETSTPESTPGL